MSACFSSLANTLAQEMLHFLPYRQFFSFFLNSTFEIISDLQLSHDIPFFAV